jgi:hypothetical protein
VRHCFLIALLPALAISFLMARAASAQSTPWSSSTALIMPQGRWEFGLLHGLHWGAREELEISLHPLLCIALPHLEAKVRWQSRQQWHLGTRHRLSYPTLFLQLVSREGDLGLLPASTRVPVAIGLDNDLLLSLEHIARHFVTFEAGVSAAPRFTSSDDMPLLDFPFLYNRFAAMKSGLTVHTGLGAEGIAYRFFTYRADLAIYPLPVIPGSYTIEQGGWVGWRPCSCFELSLGYRLSYGRYPVGERLHLLPLIDLKGAV